MPHSKDISMKKYGILSLITKEALTEIVDNSDCLSEVLVKLKLSTNGSGNFTRLKQKFIECDIDYSKLKYTKKRLAGLQKGRKVHKLENILTINSIYLGSTSSLKTRLIKENLLKNECCICGINTWLGKKLVLHLDHINGTRSDNRLENLRLICPNCHSQTETYAGKNKRKDKYTVLV